MEILIAIILAGIGIISDLLGTYEGIKGFFPKQNKVLIEALVKIRTSKRSPYILLKYFDFIVDQEVEINDANKIVFRMPKRTRLFALGFSIIQTGTYLFIIIGINFIENSPDFHWGFLLLIIPIVLMNIETYRVQTTKEIINIEDQTLKFTQSRKLISAIDISEFQLINIDKSGEVIFQKKNSISKKSILSMNLKLSEDEIAIWESIFEEIIKK